MSDALPRWVAPQLTKLVEDVPAGEQWAHEIKLDGYRMHARLGGGRVRLLTRTGLDWTDKYPATVEAFTALPVEEAYIDGELCAVAENGVTSFSAMQAASDSRSTASLIYFAFDLLYVNGENLMRAPLLERKRRLDIAADPLHPAAARPGNRRVLIRATEERVPPLPGLHRG